MNSFLTRALTHARPGKALNTLTGAAVAHWRHDFEKGRKAAENGGDPLAASFYNKIKQYEPEQTDPDTVSGQHGSYILACWAAHHLPPDLFHSFYSLALRSGNMYLSGAMLRVTGEMKDLRPEIIPPRKVAKAQRPKPKLETVETAQARERWRESQLFTIWGHTRESAAAEIAELSADDLHVIACGLCDIDCAGMIEAMAFHPRLDRGTALELFFSYSASAYQSDFRDGTADSYGKDDQTLFRAFDRLAERANTDDFATGQFANRLHDELARMADWGPSDDPDHPCNWQRWALNETALAPTFGQQPRSDLECAQSPVRYRFEVWQDKCA